MAFRIKPTHTYIKPIKDETYSENEKTTSESNTNNISNVTTGSSKGMAIRAVPTARSDCY